MFCIIKIFCNSHCGRQDCYGSYAYYIWRCAGVSDAAGLQCVRKDVYKRQQQQRYESEKIDISMPPKKIRYGNLHPVTTVRNQLTDIFASMGFEVYEGTEIETDYYNFTALNTPKDHPARDMQDVYKRQVQIHGFCRVETLAVALCKNI